MDDRSVLAVSASLSRPSTNQEISALKTGAVTEPRLSALKAVSYDKIEILSSGDRAQRLLTTSHTFETRRIEKRLPERADRQMEDQTNPEQIHNEDPPLAGERSDDFDSKERRKMSPMYTSDHKPNGHKREILGNLSWLKIDSSVIQLNVDEPSARGGKADVLPGIYTRTIFEPEQRVAVKQLRYDARTDRDKFSKARPRNGKASMVFAWEDNGNLRDFLALRDREIPERISLIQGVMAGVEYLHTRIPPICHGDLKSLNILVNSSYRAVITDFGSARVIHKRLESDGDYEQDEAANAVGGTIPTIDECATASQLQVSATGEQLTLTGPAWSLQWAAPEVLFGKPPDLPRDIWAIGWVIWEVSLVFDINGLGNPFCLPNGDLLFNQIITSKMPFHELKSEGYITMTVIQNKLPSIGQDAQISQIVSLCGLMTQCWAYDPKSRPNASKCLKNNYQAAHARYTEAIEKARFEGDKQVNAEGWNCLGEVCSAQGSYSDAGRMFDQARVLNARLGNDRGLVHALDGLGTVYRSEGKLEDARELYVEAEAICVRLGDEASLANVSNGMGAVLTAQQSSKQATEYYTRAHDIYARIGNDLGQANSFYGLGEANFSLSMYNEAVAFFHKALDLHGHVGNRKGQADALNSLGKLYQVRRKYKEAGEYFA
ncbi:hypothetical protein FRC00_003972 [Tulasnella sp. 408]|nr:hypothetical protein FRC00_003972 [Tulasnella sp. 408]